MGVRIGMELGMEEEKGLRMKAEVEWGLESEARVRAGDGTRWSVEVKEGHKVKVKCGYFESRWD